MSYYLDVDFIALETFPSMETIFISKDDYQNYKGHTGSIKFYDVDFSVTVYKGWEMSYLGRKSYLIKIGHGMIIQTEAEGRDYNLVGYEPILSTRKKSIPILSKLVGDRTKKKFYSVPMIYTLFAVDEKNESALKIDLLRSEVEITQYPIELVLTSGQITKL